jgi:hypothetical protein
VNLFGPCNFQVTNKDGQEEYFENGLKREDKKENFTIYGTKMKISPNIESIYTYTLKFNSNKHKYSLFEWVVGLFSISSLVELIAICTFHGSFYCLTTYFYYAWAVSIKFITYQKKKKKKNSSKHETVHWY